VLVHEDHVIQCVDGFEAQHERWIAVLLEDNRREKRGFQAVRAAVPNHAPKAAERRAAAGLLIVRQLIQIPLNSEGRAEARDEAAFPGREKRTPWL
jgi:hypothetical protein